MNPPKFSHQNTNLRQYFRPEKVVWHGSHTLGDRAMDTYCDAWHSSSTDRYGLGSPLTGGRLLEQVRYPCAKKFALLCIEVTSEQSKRRRRRRSVDSQDEDEDEEDVDEDVDEEDEVLLTEAEYTEQLRQLFRE